MLRMGECWCLVGRVRSVLTGAPAECTGKLHSQDAEPKRTAPPAAGRQEWLCHVEVLDEGNGQKRRLAAALHRQSRGPMTLVKSGNANSEEHGQDARPRRKGKAQVQTRCKGAQPRPRRAGKSDCATDEDLRLLTGMRQMPPCLPARHLADSARDHRSISRAQHKWRNTTRRAASGRGHG